MASAVLGIDVAKATLAVVLHRIDGKPRRKSCPNTASGHAALVAWVAHHVDGPVHVGLEATGSLHEAVATALHEAGHVVSVLNPSAVHAFAASHLSRAKTDPIDAALIARYVAVQAPPAWTPLPPAWRRLQALSRRLDALHDMRTQELNRQAAGPDPAVAPSIAATLAHLDAQIADVIAQLRAHIDHDPTLRTQRDLLVTIPGIGDTTAATVLAELLDVKRFDSVKQAAAFAGLIPHVRQSGTTHRRARLSKVGSRRLRRALYFPALTACRHNPRLRAFAARLTRAGKPKMVIVAAVMRKLVHLAYGVLRSGRPFDPALSA